MVTITTSLERSLQNCSLNHRSTTTRTRTRNRRVSTSGGMRSHSPDDSSHHNQSYTHHHHNNQDNYGSDQVIINNQDNYITHSNASSSDDNSTFVELNSHVSLPFHWEQCLDLKTGELYYVNWSNGMKAREDPRTTATGYNGDYYSEDEEQEEEEDEEEEEENDKNNNKDEEDGEESYAYDSEGSSTESNSAPSSINNFRSMKRLFSSRKTNQNQQKEVTQDSVLVVAGCKSCLMYHMVPRHVLDCPKCSGHLLHFAANTTPSSP